MCPNGIFLRELMGMLFNVADAKYAWLTMTHQMIQIQRDTNTIGEEEK